MSFKDQLELVTGARSLIIFGGAATAHLIFSKSSTRAIIVTSKINSNFTGYEVFKELSESDIFIEGIGESRYTAKQIKEGHNPNYLDAIHLSFRINLRQFIKILVREHKFLKHHAVLQQRP